ncbi:acyl-CoA thioesterase [Geobacter metallireducens GS-15]|uniref:Acyl-CoA thioesterase 2 n=1 Tax=Geobacter metallireducens (strain ATCC 53774 / DSM 7210 / GS-15) TaxID=269799 RepID=Q39TF9_GEOMG|nr:acyl-CoA thioesterase II [Geobacter metallireducens]ABB32465.1 acyl-CoA thioesterase [Geobacter metallireducens GS-15]
MKQILPEILELEQIEENLYRGLSQNLGVNRIYGGQVLGQALAAAGKTVIGRKAHSFHAYFLLMGDNKLPVMYEVDRIHEGHSFATRRVVAIQRGRAIFAMTASFQIEEKGLEHQASMPEVPAPEELPTLVETLGKMAAPNRRLQNFFNNFPIEIRPVKPVNPYASGMYLPFSSVWLRSTDRLSDCVGFHQAALAYASDYGLITTAGLPHDVPSQKGKYLEASLDHALWYHRDFRMDEWVLYVAESPSASNARGFSQGQFFSRDGRLIASVAQEGLIRERRLSVA